MISDINLKRDEEASAGGQRSKIHPHKFTLWVAMGSIVMMFAGLTSAYIVKSNQANWEIVELPAAFWYSTVVILASSLAVQLAVRSIKQREMRSYRLWIAITGILGVVFVWLQWVGFSWLWQHGVRFQGSGAGQFLYIIAGLHAVHVLGGIVALVVMIARAFIGRVRNYNAVPVEIMSTYWHFVDLLWIYLFVFFLLIR